MNDVLIGFHIFGGCLGLAALIPPFVSKKGGRLHRQSGWLFTAGLGLAGLTGLGISARFLAHQRADQAVFFGVLSVLLLENLWTGIVAVRRKPSPEQPGRPIDMILPATLATAGVLAGVYGLIEGRGLIMGFSTLSLVNGLQDLRFVARPLASRMAWWYQHMLSMMGASIAAVTAFLVLNAQRFLDLPDALIWLPWVAPSLIAVPLSIVWVRQYKERFRELKIS